MGSGKATPERTSLIQAAPEQPELFSSDQFPASLFHDEEVAGTFTGERFFSRDPQRYKECVALLAEGLGVIRIGKLLHCSPNTVRAVRDREAPSIDILKQQLQRLLQHGAQMCVEGILEDLDDDTKRGKISAYHKSIIAGVLTDKAQVLSGGATSRVEFVTQEPEHDDFNAYLDKMQRVRQSETGIAGGTPGQKGAGRPGGDPLDVEPNLAGTDSVSAGNEGDS